MFDAPDDRLTLIEALLFASDSPQPRKKVIQFIGKSSAKKMDELIEQLNESYSNEGRSFRIREVAGGFQMYLLPTYTRAVEKYLQTQRERRLSQAALETLSIVAYKQPVTKAEIEHIRGVNSDGVIASLLERKLVAIVGRSQKVGRALLYGTSRQFLEFFGLNSLDELPKLDELILPGDNNPESREQVELMLSDESPQGDETDEDESINEEESVLVGQEIDKKPDV